MGMDEDNDDGLGGRSRTRREVTEANRWGKPLCLLTDAQFALAPLPPEIREAVALGRTIASFRARDRQWQRIDKLVRALPEDVVERIDAFLADPDAPFTALRGWADRMVAGGDDVLAEWIARRPATDRQRLRSVVRGARTDPRGVEAVVALLAEVDGDAGRLDDA